MIIISFICFLFSVLSIARGKSTKKDSNVIAVFSEDDISGKLPSPESVAAEIPKNLILQKSKKLNVANVPSKTTAEEGKKNAKISKEDTQAIKTTKAKKSKTKNKKKKILNEDESFDRKSKSMNDIDEEDEAVEQFIVVESTPFSSPIATNTQIPTASIVTVTETASLGSGNIQIAVIDATTRSQGDEITTIPPQKIRQFTPRSRMSIKRANSSANNRFILDFKVIFIILFLTIFIISA